MKVLIEQKCLIKVFLYIVTKFNQDAVPSKMDEESENVSATYWLTCKNLIEKFTRSTQYA